jgi:hypothetical protein
MDTALVTVLGVALAGLLAMVQLQFTQVNRRLERIEDRLAVLEKDVTQIGQKLDDHVINHPGPTVRLER